MTVAIVHARAQLEGWIVQHVGSKEAEELLVLVNDLVEAERDRVVETNAALRDGWMASTTNRDVEMFSLRLSEKLIHSWRDPPTAN